MGGRPFDRNLLCTTICLHTTFPVLESCGPGRTSGEVLEADYATGVLQHQRHHEVGVAQSDDFVDIVLLTFVSHSIIQDFAMYILPLFIVWRLQMPQSQKIALCAILCVGLVAVAAGCVRFYYVLFLSNEADIWYYMADSLNWCSIEIYAGASLPCCSQRSSADETCVQPLFAVRRPLLKCFSGHTFPRFGVAREAIRRVLADLAHCTVDRTVDSSR